MQTPTDHNAPSLTRDATSALKRLRSVDERRSDFPGEHLIVFALGAWMLIAGMRSRTVVRRGLMTAAGTALIGRAASGTGGISRLARALRRYT